MQEPKDWLFWGGPSQTQGGARTGRPAHGPEPAPVLDLLGGRLRRGRWCRSVEGRLLCLLLKPCGLTLRRHGLERQELRCGFELLADRRYRKPSGRPIFCQVAHGNADIMFRDAEKPTGRDHEADKLVLLVQDQVGDFANLLAVAVINVGTVILTDQNVIFFLLVDQPCD